jgi:predicted nucleic acid-binding protein
MTAPVFVDTSGLYAALDASDANHAAAAGAFSRLLDRLGSDPFAAVTHSGVITEATALVQRRLGLPAARSLLDDILPLIDTVWVDARLHSLASTALLAAGQRDVSLVDWTSFVIMRERAITTAFAFDDHFDAQGFSTSITS